MAEIKYNKDGSIAKKRGRPKKVIISEEVDILALAIKKLEKEEFETILKEEKEARQALLEWDVKKGDPIKFFDKRLSYELTGYKPITDTKGLDFDPSWFTKARDTYLRTDHYTQHRFGTKAYADFWDEEYRRCLNGYTVNGYTITGPNYYYLNYYQLPNIDVEKAGSGRLAIFPKFLVFLYEFFHYFEICRILKKDAVLMKARGVGFSEINAAIAACIYNCFRESKCIVTTFAKNQLEKSLNKTWGALDFANFHTDGGFAKLRLGKDTLLIKRSSTKVKDANGIESETGWKSEIEGILDDDGNKVRGDRTDLIIYEEAGSNPVLRKAYIKGKALIYIGGSKFGIRLCGGTGGDKGIALEALREMYYDPNSFDVLPFYHNYTPTLEWAYTGYFIPSYIGAVISTGTDSKGVKRTLLDNRGYCLWENYKAQLDLDRDDIKNPKALIDHCAEYCYTADEAFNLEGENQFNKIIIAEQLTKIRALKLGPEILQGYFTFTYKSGLQRKISGDSIQDVIWTSNSKLGKVKIIELPLWMLPELRDPDTGEIIRNTIEKQTAMYVAGVDGIDIGQAQTSEYTKDPSDFCMVIYKRVYGVQEGQVVAIYKDRPQDLREAYQQAIALAMYYNALINIEATRMSFVTWAKASKLLNWFMRRPKHTYPDINKIKSTQYGTPGTILVINHQLGLIADFVEDYGYSIWFEELLDELNRYSIENKRKFDIIAALGMALLADEELNGITPKAVVDLSNAALGKLGYYIDDNGYKKFGIIPDKINTQLVYNPNYNDEGVVLSSNPRVLFGGVW